MGADPSRMLVVVGAEDVVALHRLTLAARHDSGGVLGTHHRFLRISLVKRIIITRLVIKSHDIDSHRDICRVHLTAILGSRDWSGHIKFLHCGRHSSHHLVALFGSLHRFLVEN